MQAACGYNDGSCWYSRRMTGTLVGGMAPNSVIMTETYSAGIASYIRLSSAAAKQRSNVRMARPLHAASWTTHWETATRHLPRLHAVYSNRHARKERSAVENSRPRLGCCCQSASTLMSGRPSTATSAFGSPCTGR